MSINISINGYKFITDAFDLESLAKEIETDAKSKIFEFAKKYDLQDAEIIVLDGFATNQNQKIQDGSKITLIKKGVMPEKEILKDMIEARNSPELNGVLKDACIGVAGLGGLGSNIALSLARVGVSKLIVVDFDIVEPSNLNRQQYFVKHIGMKKCDAIKDIISQVNPFVEIVTHNVYLDDENVGKIFEDCTIICEAFDNTKSKAMIANEASLSLKSKSLVLASGMAGIHSSNTIKTKKFAKDVYICGDLQNAASLGQGLMAPRVSICANHQANLAIRLLLGLDIE